MMGKVNFRIEEPEPGNRKSHNVLCVGEVLWDLLPSGAKVGGAPLNVAMHMRKFGINAVFAGRVGNDALGKELIEFISGNGLSTSLIQVDYEKPTSTVVVELSKDNNARFDIVDNVAWDRLEVTESLKTAAEKADVIIYGTLASRHSYARENILGLLDNGSIRLIDVNLRPPFDSREIVEKLLLKADIAKLNDEELRVIGEWNGKQRSEKELAKWFADKYNCGIVCITRGANGALIYDGISFFEHSGYTVNVVDTVGSGDAFLAGFLSELLSGKSIKDSLDYACATGALVASKAGATPYYSIEEINGIRNQNNIL